MKTLIIYAHPNKKGHAGLFLQEVQHHIKNATLLDLYAMKYNPVLQPEEHYTSGGYIISPQNKKIQEQILEANNLIFIYPVWWFSMPAMMKGFLDRVLTARFAFRYIGKRPVGLLKGKKALVLLTTGGPQWFYRLLLGNLPCRVMTLTLRFCGIKTKAWQVGNATTLTEKNKEKIISCVAAGVQWLEL